MIIGEALEAPRLHAMLRLLFHLVIRSLKPIVNPEQLVLNQPQTPQTPSSVCSAGAETLSSQPSALNPEPYMVATFLEIMETQKGPYKDCSPSKIGVYGFPC